MRNFLSFAVLCLLTITSIAQNNDFVFYTDNGDKFTLYLNNVKQNETAATNVKAENISGKTVAIRVDFERSGVPTFNRTLSLSSNDKEIKIQLVKGREDVYSMKTVSTTDRHHSSQGDSGNTVTKGNNGSTETKPTGNNGHGNGNNGHGNDGHGNNNGHGNGGHGNNNGYGNNGHGNNGGYGNNNHGNGGHGNGGYWNSNGYGPSDNSRCNMPMSTNEFNSLKWQVNARYFDSSRLTVAKQACRYNCMTSDQIRDLCRVFSYESSKLDFAKYAFEYCYDRYRYYIVGQSFAYSSSVDELNRYITNQMANMQQPYGGYNGGYNNYFQSDNPDCRFFMSDQDFSDLKRMINNTPYSSTKMTIAKQACMATCISAEQVREICRLFSFDSDRLTFAKFAFDHCYDRRNYFKVNEVFTFTSSVNELNRYISQHQY